MAVDVGAMVFFLYSSHPWLFVSLPKKTWLDKSKGILDLVFFFWKGLTVRKVKYFFGFANPQAPDFFLCFSHPQKCALVALF